MKHVVWIAEPQHNTPHTSCSNRWIVSEFCAITISLADNEAISFRIWEFNNWFLYSHSSCAARDCCRLCASCCVVSDCCVANDFMSRWKRDSCANTRKLCINECKCTWQGAGHAYETYIRFFHSFQHGGSLQTAIWFHGLNNGNKNRINFLEICGIHLQIGHTVAVTGI